MLFEQALDGIIISDAESGRIQRANRRAAALFGYTVEELLELRIPDLLTDTDLRSKPMRFDALRAGQRMLREREARRKDGSRFPIEVSAQVLSDGRALGLIRDITSRKQRAEVFRRQARHLGERVKEQQTLYAVSRLLQTEDSLSEALTEVVGRLPAGWEYPRLAQARITLDGTDHTTDGFEPSPYVLRHPIVVESAERGAVEVSYRRQPTGTARGGTPLGDAADAMDAAVAGRSVFLAEEADLLAEIAARIAEAVRRRQAEDRLRSSEAYYRTLAEKAVDMVSIATADGRLRYVSPSSTEILGFPVEERLGRSVFEQVHPDDVERVRAEFQAAVGQPDQAVVVEFRMRDASGGWRILEARGRNLLSDPAIGGIVIESRDVTERRNAEERIRFQARLLDSVGQAVMATDADGRIIYWNRAAETISGWSADEVMGGIATDTVGVDLTNPGSRALFDALARREPWKGEIVGARKDGTPISLLISDQPVLGESGDFRGRVVVSSDLTELKEAEGAVRRSEERLRSLAENSSDLTVVLDASARVIYASPNRERILGEDAETAVGRVFTPLRAIHERDRETAEALWRDVLDSPGDTRSGELRVQHADGSWRLLEVYARNLLDNPAVAGVVVNARDVTERAELEQQLQQAQKMEAVGRLAGGVAHDFNNLLTGIRGHTQMALDDVPPDHPSRASLEEVDRGADRAAALIRQLLAFSRRQVMQPRVVDPNQAIRGLGALLGRLIGEDVRLVTELDEAVGCVHVDPGQLEQVIVNLAVNARDAMPTGGQLALRTRPVRLERRDLLAHDDRGLTPGPYVELEVSDTGAGIPAAVLGRIFEPFFTTKEVGEGTGLGLSTVYGIVKQSGGLVRVESAEGDGTTFRVLFPRVERPPEEGADRSDSSGTVTAPDGGRILLVEDDEAVRGLALKVLDRSGYTVITAEDGAEGLRRFEDALGRGEPVDLVLSDVVMPRLGGRELVELVRESDREVPVILMSGYTDDVLLRHGVDTLGLDFLEKPFSPANLLDRVRAALQREWPGDA